MCRVGSQLSVLADQCACRDRRCCRDTQAVDRCLAVWAISRGRGGETGGVGRLASVALQRKGDRGWTEGGWPRRPRVTARKNRTTSVYGRRRIKTELAASNAFRKRGLSHFPLM
jgi:hypothetical protein